MLIDGRTIPSDSMLEADVCIVGGGPAGISLALRLGERSDRRVMLLESGGLAFDPASQELARGETDGLPYYPLHETRVRMLGGTSQSWGGVCAPLDPASLARRSWVPGGGWPLAPDALEPYLAPALDLCGIDATQRSHDAVAHERRRAAWEPVSSSVQPTLVHFSRPVRFGTRYRSRLVAHPRVSVVLHSTATDLELDPDTRRIAGIGVRCLEGNRFTVRAGAFVLAGGGVENARLLLASARRYRNGIGNQGGMVGRCFMEHPRVAARFRVRPGPTQLGRLVGRGAAGTLRFLRIELAPSTQQEEQLLAWHANLQFGYAGQDSPAWTSVRRVAIATRAPWRESPYFQDGGGGRTHLTGADVRSIARRPVAGLLGAVGAAVNPARLRRWLEVIGSVEQLPSMSNRIELTDVVDPLAMPRVRITWGVSEAERRTHDRAMELLLAALERLEPGIGARHIPGDGEWPGGIVGTWHHIGATRMSPEPGSGVVDLDGRVHGTANLFVVGSSVFPVSGSTSPTVTVVQLGLRLADHLVEWLDRRPLGVGIPVVADPVSAVPSAADVPEADRLRPPHEAAPPAAATS